MRREAHDLFEELSGQAVGERWEPPRADFYRVGREGDFPYLVSHVPVFSERALDVLLPLVGTEVEKLPLRTPSGSNVGISVLDTLDCLDLERSKIDWLDEDRILYIERYVFEPEKVEGRHIFKISQQPFSFVYVTEAFRQAVEESGLQGLALEKVWG